MWREVALQHRITSISTVWIAYLINYLFILISGFVSKWTSLQAVWVRNWRAHWKKAALPLKENQSGPGRSTGRGFSTSRWDCCSSVWKSGMKLLKTAWAIESDFFNLHHRFIHFICFGFFFFFLCLFVFWQVDALTLSGEMPVSVYTYRQSQNEEHLLLVMENVERMSSFLSFSRDVSTPLFSILLQM